MIHQYNIKGTPEVYTIAVNCCGGDWGFACRVYDDMTRKGVVPDEVPLLASLFLHLTLCSTCLSSDHNLLTMVK